jgi:hypothetical protein
MDLMKYDTVGEQVRHKMALRDRAKSAFATEDERREMALRDRAKRVFKAKKRKK